MLVHYSDRGSQHLVIAYAERIAAAGVDVSVGNRGDSYYNALTEIVISLFKAVVIRRQAPWRSLDDVEFATLSWVHRFDITQLFEPFSYLPPQSRGPALRDEHPVCHTRCRVPTRLSEFPEGSGLFSERTQQSIELFSDAPYFAAAKFDAPNTVRSMLIAVTTANTEPVRAGPEGRRESAELAFERLVCEARSCTACPRMHGRTRVLSRRNGALDARVLFVAEAPGRLGAEVTGVPLAGDQSGRNFERMLGSVGLTREDVFVTNAVLCNPLTTDGRNDKPSASEIVSCNRFLAGAINVIAPDLVIAFGVAALAALERLEPHGLTLREHLARPVPWYGRLLAPLYHPSPRTRVFRSPAEQVMDLARCLVAASAYADLNIVGRVSDRTLEGAAFLGVSLPSA